MNCTLRDRIEKWNNQKVFKRGIYLHHLGLKFTHQQLQQLNGYFADLEMNTDVANRITKFNHLESQVERVLLRLNFIIGTLDDRFMSTFLIKLDQRKVFFENSGTYSYLIRLDRLSVPRICKKITSRAQCRIFELDNKFQGFGKIQLKGETLKQWIDFVDDAEFLRDEVRRKYAELMTKAISTFRDQQFTKPYDSRCLFHHSHSLVVDADVLQHILNMPPEQRLFYGLSATETKDWLNVDIDFDSSGELFKLEMKDFSTFDGTESDFSAVTIKLYLGINFEGLPVTTDYPLRIPLFDSHALLHQQAATSGFYMVAADPKCVAASSFEDASISWRFQFPAVEQVLSTHYSNYSVFARMANIVYNVTSNMRNTARSLEQQRRPPGRTVVSKYVIRTLVWFQLEIFHDPVYWTSNYLAFHTLSLLDRLIAALKTRSCRSYFFARFDLMKNTSAAHPDDRRSIGNGKTLENFVRRVHSMYYDLFGYESVFSQNRYPSYLLRYENALTRKWNDFLNDGRHNRNEKSRKRIKKGINHYYGEDFSQRQLDYLVQVLRGVLFVCSIKSIDMKEISEDDIYANTGTSNINELLLHFPLIYNHYRVEYVMRIVLVMMEQSLALYTDTNAEFASSARRTNRSSIGKLRSSYSSVFKYRKKIDYDKTVGSFLNGVRATVKDDFLVQDITDDVEFVRYIMKLLVSKINQNKRIRRILKPYLNRLVLSAHSNCWFLDRWRDNMRHNELTSLRVFARLLSKRKISPYNGLMDALYKGWQWPVCIVKCLMMLSGQKISLMSQKSDGSIVQYSLNFSVERMKKLKYQLLCNNWSFCNRGKYSRAEHLFGILNPNGGYDDTDQEVGLRTELRKIGIAYIRTKLNSMSPITYIIENQRRYGVHKYLGNIIEAFVLLDKFSILREMCSILPQDKRKQVLEDIHFISREKYRSNLSFRSLEEEVLGRRHRNSMLSEDSEFLPTYRTLNDCSNDKNRFDRKVRQQSDQQEEPLSDRKSFISLISSFSSVLEVPYENC